VRGGRYAKRARRDHGEGWWGAVLEKESGEKWWRGLIRGWSGIKIGRDDGDGWWEGMDREASRDGPERGIGTDARADMSGMAIDRSSALAHRRLLTSSFFLSIGLFLGGFVSIWETEMIKIGRLELFLSGFPSIWRTAMIRARRPEFSISLPSSSVSPAVIYVGVSMLSIPPCFSSVILSLPPSISLAFPCPLTFILLSRPFSAPPRGPLRFSPLFSVGLNSCGRSSRAFISLTVRSLILRSLLLAWAAVRGERRVRGMKVQERRQLGFTAEGELRTEPRGSVDGGGRGVDWVRGKGMNRSWGSTFPEL
jgi:hypothetical protein